MMKTAIESEMLIVEVENVEYSIKQKCRVERSIIKKGGMIPIW